MTACRCASVHRLKGPPGSPDIGALTAYALISASGDWAMAGTKKAAAKTATVNRTRLLNDNIPESPVTPGLSRRTTGLSAGDRELKLPLKLRYTNMGLSCVFAPKGPALPHFPPRTSPNSAANLRVH